MIKYIEIFSSFGSGPPYPHYSLIIRNFPTPCTKKWKSSGKFRSFSEIFSINFQKFTNFNANLWKIPQNFRASPNSQILSRPSKKDAQTFGGPLHALRPKNPKTECITDLNDDQLWNFAKACSLKYHKSSLLMWTLQNLTFFHKRLPSLSQSYNLLKN